MNNIVCMIRGGEASRAVQERALALAQQDHKPVVFIHVTTMPSSVAANDALTQVAGRELSWLGQVVLSMARKRALARGVEVQTVMRFEPVYEAILTYLQENNADILLLGRPHVAIPDYEARYQQVQQFAQRLTEATGVAVEIV